VFETKKKKEKIYNKKLMCLMYIVCLYIHFMLKIQGTHFIQKTHKNRFL